MSLLAKLKIGLHFIGVKMGKADTHLHTQYSGFTSLGPMRFPESITTPEFLVDYSRKLGMDVICVSDHNAVNGAFKAREYAKKYDDIDVVIGNEIMTSDGEIIGFGLTEDIPPMLTVEETVDKIREQGALTIAPHPFSFHVRGLKEKIFDIDLDAFEVINGGHPDKYSNNFAQLVMDKFPGRWAPISASDSHSKFTMGYNWTEFKGNTEDDLIKAIKNKTTVPKGSPSPVLGEVQWSYEVVIGGQKLLRKGLNGKLKPEPDNKLITKVLSIPDLYKIAGLLGGAIYMVPPTQFIAALFSTAYLKYGAIRMNRDAKDRLGEILKIVEGVDATKALYTG
jgi:predicted metal-dependent phosphoesterase TrpH